MIIVEKDNRETFRDIPYGAVFIDKYSNYCMKIETPCDMNYYYNFVHLTDGTLGNINVDEKIDFVKGSFVVE